MGWGVSLVKDTSMGGWVGAYVGCGGGVKERGEGRMWEGRRWDRSGRRGKGEGGGRRGPGAKKTARTCRQIQLTHHFFSCTVRTLNDVTLTSWLKNVFVRITSCSRSSMSCD